MFRKLIVIVCLLSFTPIAVGAQELAGLTMGEWADIHFSNYRWVWWLGGVIVLVALHAVAISKD